MERPAGRETILTGVDAALLAAIQEEQNLVRACRRLGISRDRGVYRLRRLDRALGEPVTRSVRGGRSAGHTRLTPLGNRLMTRGRETLLLTRSTGSDRAMLASSIVHGTWSARPSPSVRLPAGLLLHVGFDAEEGQTVRVAIDPEVVLVARHAFPTSARNTLRGIVRRVGRIDRQRSTIAVDLGGARLRAVVTPQSLRALRITKGSRVFLYLKANAIRLVDLGPVPSLTHAGPKSSPRPARRRAVKL